MCQKFKMLFYSTLLISTFLISSSDTARHKRQNSSETATISESPGTNASDGYTGSNYTSLKTQKDLKADAKGKVVVKIGHIGAQGVLPNDDQILNLSRLQLLEEGLLGKNFDFE